MFPWLPFLVNHTYCFFPRRTFRPLLLFPFPSPSLFSLLRPNRFSPNTWFTISKYLRVFTFFLESHILRNFSVSSFFLYLSWVNESPDRIFFFSPSIYDDCLEKRYKVLLIYFGRDGCKKIIIQTETEKFTKGIFTKVRRKRELQNVKRKNLKWPLDV